ncbi:glycerate kinase-like [Physella acuta]|uniref:glycerate kinase-like n=1 Tax=Physella acuta TaxID=109671 RepID=UPI0027DE84C8|nr:glycerate kinase-like [Physella acuta]XP_059161445.1 glycerate kinase-like [Physella acuta]XP_059161446.1 glycerate kinase-like [Physella acuta]
MSLMSLTALKKLTKINLLRTTSTLTHIQQPRPSHHKSTRYPCGKFVLLQSVTATTVMMQDHATSFTSVSSKTKWQIEATQLLRQAKEMFACAVTSVLPLQMIRNKLAYNPTTSILQVDSRKYKLNKNVHVVGFGKAVLGMARALEDTIGEHIVRGVISVPVGLQEALRQEGKGDMTLLPSSNILVMEGAANNLPDTAAFESAQQIKEIAQNVGKDDILVVLISGGGSALLPAPEPPVTLEDMLNVTKLLSRSGADIRHLNTVRKQIDLLKGGGLAQLAWPAQVISLILSDVIGDPLDFIASGPTVPDTSHPEEVLELFSRFNVEASVPQTVLTLLQGKLEKQKSVSAGGNISKDQDLPDPGSSRDSNPWGHVQNVLIGTNKIACEAASQKSLELGYHPVILTTELQGEAREVGSMFAYLALYTAVCMQSSSTTDTLVQLERKLIADYGIKEDILSDISNIISQRESPRLCLVAGGETTVTVRGSGKGGRNQEMAVSAAVELHAQFGKFKGQQDLTSSVSAVFLSAGTDGQDGPTSAAGGVVGLDFIPHLEELGLRAEDYLEGNDTHTLLSMVENGSGLVVTGLTGTNVMDIQLLLVRKI